MEIIRSLENSEIITKFEIHDFRKFTNGFYIKITAHVKNNTTLYIKEYSDTVERNYSYHWQKENGALIIRWDNAPFHSEVNTYPHHKHIDNNVESSYNITIDDILKEIEKFLHFSK